ncbi:MAG: intradiol ring-cleavage dioxygenase [Burkholderiales bacterium PBB4]|nr:MAG: intradiol ring-cleavage dioxygenase [Burkholderiales bacterium PBB4]
MQDFNTYPSPHGHSPTPHPHGLAGDLQTLIRTAPDRRSVLRWLTLGSVAPLGLMACGGGGDSDPVATNTSSGQTTSTTASGTCSAIPSETGGPYPGDGTNNNASGIANALTLSGIVRSDIRSSIAGASAVAGGVPLTVTLKLVNTGASCASLAGYAVYLWHCTREGGYSMYSSGITAENYLRGVQVSDSNGEVSFTTIVPGCYSGRWPHIHFEVFSSLTAATTLPAGDAVRTSQLALPKAICDTVYATSGYEASVSNLAAISLASDNVFGNDSAALQMAVVTGSVATGYAASLTVGV